jgi:2-methylisocitrate lyase-like PEP mutase family enzyme
MSPTSQERKADAFAALHCGLAVPSLTVGDIVAAGAQRISVGGSLSWVAAKAFADAAIAIRDEGDARHSLPCCLWLSG